LFIFSMNTWPFFVGVRKNLMGFTIVFYMFVPYVGSFKSSKLNIKWQRKTQDMMLLKIILLCTNLKNNHNIFLWNLCKSKLTFNIWLIYLNHWKVRYENMIMKVCKAISYKGNERGMFKWCIKH
jgi:hypothetical protein